MQLDEYYWYWLCNIPGIGSRKLTELLSVFASPKEIYRCEERILREAGGLSQKQMKALLDAKRDTALYEGWRDLGKRGIQFLHFGGKGYPEKMKDLYDVPYGLYCKGTAPDEKRPSVAVVGARDCSEYGEAVAEDFARAFARMGIQVISGMALGVDSAGHRGAILGGGETFAVLGCGVDVCYPRANIGLYTDIQKRGGILSEFTPGTPPLAKQFPSRNRIIAALADVVVVVEAREKSGSLITADQALEQNREVMVVPGRITDQLSAGCNDLIQQGAAMITRPEDILGCAAIREKMDQEGWNIVNTVFRNTQTDEKHGKLLAQEEQMLYSCLDLYPKSLARIIEETGLEMTDISCMLLELMLDGRVKEVSRNCYVRTQAY